MIKRNRASTSYLNNALNRSPSKETHRFPKAERFVPEKKHSPDKFYDVPETLDKRGTSIGYGKKTDIVLKELNDPGRYNIRSEFDQIAQGYRFGMRPSFFEVLEKDSSDKKYWQPKERSPQKYTADRSIAQRYTPQKKTPTKSRGPSPKKQSQLTTANKQRSRSELNEENKYVHERKSAKRLKYEYSEQYLVNNNRTSYTEFIYPKKQNTKNPHSSSMLAPHERKSPQQKSTKNLHSTFAREERMRQKQLIPPNVGPGSYNAFSQFGDNLRYL